MSERDRTALHAVRALLMLQRACAQCHAERTLLDMQIARLDDELQGALC